jgi:hypothetical protein
MTTQSGQTICLSMIVKNEAQVILRCLESVRGLIDHWVIVDTGSTDGTQDIIRQALADLPGELYERPWQDFSHNRTEALALSRPRADFSLVIDADDALDLPPGYVAPHLELDSYQVDIHDVGVRYQRQQLVRNALAWRYRGVLHEFLTSDEPARIGNLPIIMRRNHDGARRRDPQTYRRDAAVLETAFAVEADPMLRARYCFYLAQSYRDFGEKALSVQWYRRRAEMGHWAEEVFYSLYQAGHLMTELGQDSEEVLAIWARATAIRPSRAEAAHAGARLCRLTGQHQRGYELAYAARDVTIPPDGLFVERWIYDYGLQDELAVTAYWSGHPAESLNAALRALASGVVPEGEISRMVANARFAADRLTGQGGVPVSTDGHALDAPRVPAAVLTQPVPRVLLAILARQHEAILPSYLACIEALDYPKSAMVISIRTNNNTDATRDILEAWAKRVRGQYAYIEMNDADEPEPLQQFGRYEWNAMRFKVLGRLRAQSLQRTLVHRCDFYFVADVDNFLRPETLRHLVSAQLPIVAPFLRTLEPQGIYSNFHADVDANGYFREGPRYGQIFARQVMGLIEVPVVNCTYLIRSDALGYLTYVDATDRHDYVIFSESARKAGVTQYLDNRQVYGYLALGDAPDIAAQVKALLGCKALLG